MRKILTILFVLLASSLVFASGASEDVVKVGFIGPMTGDNANYGILISNSAKLAVNEINAKGGIGGKKLELVVEDSEGDPQKGLTAIEQLSSRDNIVALIGPVFSGVSQAVAGRVQAEGIPMITPSGTNKNITLNGNYVFRTVISDGYQSDIAGPLYYDEGIRRLAILYVKNDYSQGLYEGIKDSFTKAGGEVVAVETAQIGDKDFKTQLTKLRSVNPDAIAIPNYYVEMAQILKQAKQLGITSRFVATDGFSNPDIFKLAGSDADGVLYTGQPLGEVQSEEFNKFEARYEKEFGVKPDSFATNSYEASYILFAAMDRAFKKDGKFERKTIRDEIEATKDFQGVSGVINFDKNGDIVGKMGVFYTENQQPTYRGTYQILNGELKKVD